MDASLNGDSVVNHFWVSVTLIYDIVSRIIVSGAYLLYHLRWKSQNWCVDSSSDGGVVHNILCHFYLDIDVCPQF